MLSNSEACASFWPPCIVVHFVLLVTKKVKMSWLVWLHTNSERERKTKRKRNTRRQMRKSRTTSFFIFHEQLSACRIPLVHMRKKKKRKLGEKIGLGRVQGAGWCGVVRTHSQNNTYTFAHKVSFCVGAFVGLVRRGRWRGREREREREMQSASNRESEKQRQKRQGEKNAIRKCRKHASHSQAEQVVIQTQVGQRKR